MNLQNARCNNKDEEVIVDIYERTNVMQLGSMFICNCNIAVHVSDTFCIHLQEHLKIVVTASGVIGYFTPSHVIHQRLLLQFVGAPEDGRKKRPKLVEYYCSY